MSKFSCPNCLTSYPLKKRESVGKRVRCRKCEQAFTVALDDEFPTKLPTNDSGISLEIALEPIPSLSPEEFKKHNQAVQESQRKFIIGVGITFLGIVFFFLFSAIFNRTNKLAQDNSYAPSPVRQPNFGPRMDDIDERIRETSPVDSRAIDRLRSDVDRLADDVRRDTNERINRRNGQEGYSLEVRKEAAIRTLMQQGHTASEAREMVDGMVKLNILPDPPRR